MLRVFLHFELGEDQTLIADSVRLVRDFCQGEVFSLNFGYTYIIRGKQDLSDQQLTLLQLKMPVGIVNKTPPADPWNN